MSSHTTYTIRKNSFCSYFWCFSSRF